MAKRSLGELSAAQRIVLQDWAGHMSVGEAQMVNMMNSLEGVQGNTPWHNLDIVAREVKACDCVDC